MTIDNERMLESFRLKNFKAVVDSGEVKLTPLTAFIGNNGAGKSSLIEGLELFQSLALKGLTTTMKNAEGFQNIWNQVSVHETKRPRENGERVYLTNPMSFGLTGHVSNLKFTTFVELGVEPGDIEVFIRRHNFVIENGASSHTNQDRSDKNIVNEVRTQNGSTYTQTLNLPPDLLYVDPPFSNFIKEWQFVSLTPEIMKKPIQTNSIGFLKEGSNVGEYLFNIRNIDPGIIDGILETLQYVLPYANDLTPSRTGITNSYDLQLSEGNFKLPGSLLSSGTLRLVALLALLRHPRPAPLIVIEEIENGLDPRTINLIVSEIRNLIESGKSQVIITTHSPYLLDLLDLSHIVLVERVDGQPTFTRPADQPTLQKWAKSYAPGELYIRDRFSVRD